MITIFIITDNVRHWAEDKGYPNECIRHTHEKTTVCIGDIQIIIANKLPITLRGYKIDKWIIDKPITRKELQEIQWSLNPARIINLALIVDPNENEQIRRFRTNPSCAEYS